MKDELRNCFGSEDLEFASHSSDRRAAAELIPELMKKAYKLTDIETEVRVLLTEMFNEKEEPTEIRWDLANKHIDKQVEKVKEHYRPWVNS